MSGGFLVSPETLSEKAKEITEVGASLKECATAGEQMGVGGLVYGVFFDPGMLPVLSTAKGQLVDLISDLATTADKISTKLDANAKTYAGVETFLHEHFSSLRTDTAGGTRGR